MYVSAPPTRDEINHSLLWLIGNGTRRDLSRFVSLRGSEIKWAFDQLVDVHESKFSLARPGGSRAVALLPRAYPPSIVTKN